MGKVPVVMPPGETEYFRCPGNHKSHLNEKLRSEIEAEEAEEAAIEARKKAEYDAIPYHTQGVMMRRHAAGQLHGT